MDERKRSGQIPVFGNRDMTNELPITQYFECARQASIVRYSSSSGDCDHYTTQSNNKPLPVRNNNKNNSMHYYSNTRHKQATIKGENRCQHGSVVVAVNEKGNDVNVNVIMARKQGKVYDVVLEQPIRGSKQLNEYDTVPHSPPRKPPKPVDEDLYKIPAEVIHTTKRKRILDFISKCLVPTACISKAKC